MARPTGVTVIAVLDFIGAGLCALAGLAVIFGAGFMGAMLGQGQASGSAQAGGLVAMLGGALGIVLLIIAAISALIGWGMLGLKSWARIVQIVFAVLGLLGALMALMNFSSAILLGMIIRIAINGWILWYLLQKDVAAAFGQSQTRAVGA